MVVVVFDNFGPYHLARLKAAAKRTPLTGIEVAGVSYEYSWIPARKSETIRIIQLLPEATSVSISKAELATRLWNALSQVSPGAVLVPGWSTYASLATISWCTAKKIPSILMSESGESDQQRVWWEELIKQRIVRLCSSSLVGGQTHVDYAVKLGMGRERCFTGYDTVDNQYFAIKAEEARLHGFAIRRKCGLPENFFLASARFIAKKNLLGLIGAYACYRAEAERIGKTGSEIWELVLLGDGHLRSTIESHCSKLQIKDHVHMPGFKQYPDLPVYYGLAKAFIHASTTEQWGLVVNEAMASGLPVLVSNRCGCARDLVKEGVNGYTFNPYDGEQLAQLMVKLADLKSELSSMGAASKRIIANWGPERFADGLTKAIESAVKNQVPCATLFDRVLLRILMQRSAA
ncbi:MAG TPA: glycosyltransferase [Clostridia bacterium]|nr:glycosyltransferase [Clostridia bacterium]